MRIINVVAGSFLFVACGGGPAPLASTELEVPPASPVPTPVTPVTGGDLAAPSPSEADLLRRPGDLRTRDDSAAAFTRDFALPAHTLDGAHAPFWARGQLTVSVRGRIAVDARFVADALKNYSEAPTDPAAEIEISFWPTGIVKTDRLALARPPSASLPGVRFFTVRGSACAVTVLGFPEPVTFEPGVALDLGADPHSAWFVRCPARDGVLVFDLADLFEAATENGLGASRASLQAADEISEGTLHLPAWTWTKPM